MTHYQLDRSEVRRLVESVRGGAATRSLSSATSGPSSARSELDEVAVARLFAISTWTTLVEPGDAVAGIVIGAVGADRALTMLIEGCAAAQWREALPAELSHELTEADLDAAVERWRPRLSSRSALRALAAAARCGARLVIPADPVWPAGFADLGAHAPLALWVRGVLRELSHPGGSVAIVGSRDATNYGEHVAMDLASGLSDRGLAVVSGAAYGIDGMAHRASLASRGATVAYLAGGVDRLYPSAHHELLLRVMASGAVVSELACGSAPTKWRFLQRNRLIAAASQATVVVEAGRRSGSLNTAGHAAALGRPLGAVPGPVTSATSAGCHRLLREYDAHCVTSAADIVELVFGPVGEPPRLVDDTPDSNDGADVADGSGPGTGGGLRGDAAETVRVLDALSRRAERTVDDVARGAGMAPRAVVAVLGVLALDGTVEETSKGWRRVG
ncbi:MAG: DNA-protecting protein DprA [Herbiconiux sp.]|uniref:DNA-processing protein DprA n=1 Tax=Herbiconiux sp. TaxID=1871186 RepID=UPI0012106E20|nr:DNA-processing protein DprA [Herbiconiux sp.]TAJ47137.1 MAG: DNA-protecting protein DprA [Herbiconiux sp.]